MSATLHDFIVTNRDEIITRARLRLSARMAPKSIEAKLDHGIPLFLTQLADALVSGVSSGPLRLVGAADNTSKRISDSAARHGEDLLRNGLTVAQVVHGYGDICQIVTELASETDAPISAEAFHVFNRCLDDAIAGAVTAYGRKREHDLAYQGTERLGVLSHELRNLLNTAILSFAVIKKGMVGLAGSTGAVHARSLSGLRALVERSLAEVRLEAGVPALEPILLSEFIEEVEVSANLQAEGHGLHLTVEPVESGVTLKADRQLLASAVSNLLHNAFKFTRPHSTVLLVARATEDRILIEVKDECGGLPEGKVEQLFHPFSRGSTDTSGLGLGLSIALNAARANAGDLYVRDVPGHGCVFTLDLPRFLAPHSESVFHPLPDAAHGSLQVSGQVPERKA